MNYIHEHTADSTTQNVININVSELPSHESDALCRVLIHSITEAFKNPKIAADYKRWLTKRKQRTNRI